MLPRISMPSLANIHSSVTCVTSTPVVYWTGLEFCSFPQSRDFCVLCSVVSHFPCSRDTCFAAWTRQVLACREGLCSLRHSWHWVKAGTFKHALPFLEFSALCCSSVVLWPHFLLDFPEEDFSCCSLAGPCAWPWKHPCWYHAQSLTVSLSGATIVFLATLSNMRHEVWYPQGSQQRLVFQASLVSGVSFKTPEICRERHCLKSK